MNYFYVIESNLVAFGHYLSQNFRTLAEEESLKSEGIFYFKVGQVVFVLDLSTRDFFGEVLSKDVFVKILLLVLRLH